MKWQTIESAPKDGTSVLVINDDGHVYEAAYDDTCEKFRFPSADQHGCGCCSGSDDAPTHWMPLPALPVEDGAI